MKEKLAQELAKNIIDIFKKDGIKLEEKDIPMLIEGCKEILSKNK